MQSLSTSIPSMLSSSTSITTSAHQATCDDGLKCIKSGICIDTDLMCDGHSDCPDNEDEPEDCIICIGDNHQQFGGSFKYHSYDGYIQAMKYKNTAINLSLYPTKTGFVVASDDNPQYLLECVVSNTTTSNIVISDCLYWKNSTMDKLENIIYVDIGCKGCDFHCDYSGICIDDSKLCNGETDCVSNIDEKRCNVSVKTQAPTLTHVSSIPTTAPSINIKHSIPDWIDPDTHSTNITFYVSSVGHDAPNCGTETNACGTILFTLEYAKSVSSMIKDIDSVTIVIRGQSKTDIASSNQNDHQNLCYFWLTFDESTLPFHFITFTFEVSSKEDWFPTKPSNSYLCDSPSVYNNVFNVKRIRESFFDVEVIGNTDKNLEFTVTINNMIINDWTVFDKDTVPNFIIGQIDSGFQNTGNLNVQYILHNFTFINNHIMYCPKALVVSAQIEINNSTFNNNTIDVINGAIFSMDINTYGKAVSTTVNPATFILKTSLINNLRLLHSSSFVDITQIRNEPEVFVAITHSVFNDTEVVDGSIINIFGDIQSNRIDIRSVRFTNIIGNIINVSNAHSGDINIKDIHISTSQMIRLNDTNARRGFPYLFHIENSQLHISNINIDYYIVNELVDHCYPKLYLNQGCLHCDPFNMNLNNWNLSDLGVGYVNWTKSIVYECDTPIPFINVIDYAEVTQVFLSSITVTTDITQQSLNGAKQILFDNNIPYCSIDHYNVSTTIYYLSESDQFMTKSVGFITVNGGYVQLNGLQMYGGGPNSITILQKGIHGVDYVSASNINNHYGAYCNYECTYDVYGLNINNFAYNNGDGTMIINNSVLYGAMDRIVKLESGHNNYIINSTLMYGAIALYASPEVKYLHIIDSDFINVGKYYAFPVWMLQSMSLMANDNIISRMSPLIISARYISFENCYFKTDDNNGIIVFSPQWPSEIYSWYLQSTVTFMNNTIEKNDSGYLYNASSLPMAILSKGIINVIGNVEFNVIETTMIVDDDKNNQSLFYGNTTKHICFSGNTLSGSTIIEADSGVITSCFRDNMVNIFANTTKCIYESLGKEKNFSFTDSSPMDHFTALKNTSIIKTRGHVIVMLDNITINTAFEDTGGYSIMNMDNGTFVFVDMILKNNIYFMYDAAQCVIHCYDVLSDYNQSKQYIAQLHLDCHNNATELTPLTIDQSSLVNHTTAYYIYFDYNCDFVVDSDLCISFFITDQFGNALHDYVTSISIWFSNDELLIHNLNTVYLSDIICLNPISTNKQSGKHYRINTITNHAELLPGNNIDIEIIGKDWTKHIQDYDLLYLLFLLIIPCVIIAIATYKYRKKYMNAFIVNKCLVLIIGISQFDDKTKFLPGVQRSVSKLVHLWRDIYNYNVNVCNENTLYNLYCTKMDIIDFIDKQMYQLDATYNGAIVHVITHGNEDDSFTTSDDKTMTTDFIEHEITEHAKWAQSELIKVVYHHTCRGTANHSKVNNNKNIAANKKDINSQRNNSKTKSKHIKADNIPLVSLLSHFNSEQNFATRTNSNSTEANEHSKKSSVESNYVDIYNTKHGRTVSDNGHFTDCIRDAFGGNVKRRIKNNFKTLIVDIGCDLEQRTKHVELCTSKGLGSMRYPQVRYEKYTGNYDHEMDSAIIDEAST